MMNHEISGDKSITTWRQFTQIIRSKGCALLNRLDDFPDSVLVAGCQRSGTTMLARIITQSAGMTNYWFGEDDELDAALILSGYVDHAPRGRYCFQTTYLDECFREYYDHKGRFKIVWVIRNPYSVAYSLLYNWGPGALEGTFETCAVDQLHGFDRMLYPLVGSRWIPPVKQAALLYNAKVFYMRELVERLGRDRIYVVDYDDLVLEKERILKAIYHFISLDYSPEYSESIHNKSLGKKGSLSDHEVRVIRDLSEPVYQQAKQYRSINPVAG